MKPAYKPLWLMLLLHFVVMFAVMYTMVDTFADVFMNLNQLYMTVMMVAPTALTMLLLMPSMYPNRRLNAAIYAGSIAIFLLFLFFMRSQAFVGDRQFLRSMIPHHSGAILMCERSAVSDPTIVELCRQIVESQKKEIAQMKGLLERL